MISSQAMDALRAKEARARAVYENIATQQNANTVLMRQNDLAKLQLKQQGKDFRSAEWAALDRAYDHLHNERMRLESLQLNAWQEWHAALDEVRELEEQARMLAQFRRRN
jgi:hypothetical protein